MGKEQHEVITLWTLEGCPYCEKVKRKLHEKGLDYREIVIERSNKPEEVRSTGGTVPVIRVNEKLISDSSRICDYLDENY